MEFLPSLSRNSFGRGCLLLLPIVVFVGLLRREATAARAATVTSFSSSLSDSRSESVTETRFLVDLLLVLAPGEYTRLRPLWWALVGEEGADDVLGRSGWAAVDGGVRD